jgi:TPR repeat protein
VDALPLTTATTSISVWIGKKNTRYDSSLSNSNLYSMFAESVGICFIKSNTSFSLETYFGSYLELSLGEITAVVAADPENDLARNRMDNLLANEASDQSEKIQLIQAAVDRGCPAAQLFLGTIYRERNEPELTLHLIKMSAEAGLDKSQLLLSVLLEKDIEGVEGQVDVKEEVKCVIRSASNGDPGAQALVSLLFSGEKGTEKFKNVAKAFHFASLSAAQGNDLGRYRLGLLLKDGVGCEKNEEKAIEVLTLAAEKGFYRAISALGCSTFEGRMTDKLLIQKKWLIWFPLGLFLKNTNV